LNGKSLSLEDSGMENVVIEDKSSATAYHIPEGHCYIYHPGMSSSAVHKEQVSTRELLPTLLENFGVPIPEYAVKPRRTILT